MEKLKKWGIAAGIRALKTMAQTAAAMIATAAFMSDIAWASVLSASVLAGILSILTSVAGIPEVNGGEPLPEIADQAQNSD